MTDMLYSTRALSLLMLPPGWSNAVLYGTPPVWYYRCDLAFLAWAESVALKMGSALSAEDARALDTIRCHVYDLNGITDDTPDRLPTPGGKLSLAPQIEALSLYDAHIGPGWPGMSELADHLKFGLDGAGRKEHEPRDKEERRDYVPPPRLRTVRG